MSYKNKSFSESFGRLLLIGFSKANAENCKQYLDLMESFLCINDHLKSIRFEWIFGYANLKINPADGYESKPNLDEEVVTYETKLKTEGVFSVLHILFTNRKT